MPYKVPNYTTAPSWCKKPLQEYIEQGLYQTDIFDFILSNAEEVTDLLLWLADNAPNQAVGNSTKVKAWRQIGGLQGIKALQGTKGKGVTIQ